VDSLPGSHLVFPVGPLLACRRRGLLLSRRAFLVQGRAASQVYVRVGNRALSRVAHLALSRAESRVGRRRVARVASQVPNLVASRAANLALSPVENHLEFHLEFRLVVRVVNPHLSRHASLLLCQAANRACVRQRSLPVNRVVSLALARVPSPPGIQHLFILCFWKWKGGELVSHRWCGRWIVWVMLHSLRFTSILRCTRQHMQTKVPSGRP
jgi:hypothetical protein